MAMKMTLRELLQYKNEIERAVKAILAGPRHSYLFGDKSVAYGVTHINGVRQDASGEPFPEHLSRLTRLMELNDKVQTRLAEANMGLGVPSLVRQRENAKAQLVLVDGAIQKSKPRNEIKTVTIAGGGVQTVSERFEPWISAAALKKQSRDLRRTIRELQSKIDALNARPIDVDFDLGLLDDLVSPNIDDQE